LMPFLLQDPPRFMAASHRDRTGPPAASIFFSFKSAKNAMVWLFGDQKGSFAPSVPGNERAAKESSSRTQSLVLPSEVATNAKRRPSGETAGTLAVVKVAFSGGGTGILRTRVSLLGWRKARKPSATAMSVAAAATTQGIVLLRRR